MAKASKKRSIEILLKSATIAKAKSQRKWRKSRNLITVDLLWPRNSIARKTSAREANFVENFADFTQEEWAKRMLFREEVEDHTAVAVGISESLNTENIEKFFRLTAKYALKTSADFVEKYTVGISDIASAPIEALAVIAGTYPGPETILQGVADIPVLPDPGRRHTLFVKLHAPGKTEELGELELEIRALE
jgi:hypothetical protein